MSDFRKVFDIEGENYFPDASHLEALSEFMSGGSFRNSKIPAGYTYLGQLIDHDITLDSLSERENPAHQPWNTIEVSAIRNLRNPVFDLETIYAFEEPTEIGNLTRQDLIDTEHPARLKIGETKGVSSSHDEQIKKTFPNDLPRKPGSVMAAIFDSRNDENLLVAQTQVAFMKFHNAIAKQLEENGENPTFERVRELTIRHYQHIILTDYLPRIVKKDVLDEVEAKVRAGEEGKFYNPTKTDLYLPLEFTVAAFRTGHAMIRSEYNWNKVFSNGDANLDRLFKFTGRGRMEDTGRKSLPTFWIINWNLFYEINEINDQKFNFAKKIGTKMSAALRFLPPVPNPKANSLAMLDLFRGRAVGLPTGQAVARELAGEDKVLKAFELKRLLPSHLQEVFAEKTPLWFYLLAEAEIESDGETLGEVGSRLVAETFLRLLKISPFSILETNLETNDFSANNKFGMPEMLKFIASKEQSFDELNPLN